MHATADTQKRAVNLSISARTLDQAKALGMNLSKTVEAFLQEEVKRRYWEAWNERNKDAIEAYNQRLHQHGLPLAKFRAFGQSLGNGQE
jgi:antitoxin CcdA